MECMDGCRLLAGDHDKLLLLWVFLMKVLAWLGTLWVVAPSNESQLGR